jgi:hypothetical protein
VKRVAAHDRGGPPPTPETATAARTRPSRRAIIVWIAGCAFFALFLARTGVSQALPLLGRLTPGIVLTILAGNALIPLLKLIRWHALLLASGVRTSRRRLVVPVSAGFFWGLVTPGTSGEMGRGLLLGVPKRVGVATVLAEKLFDAAALLGLALAAVTARVGIGMGLSVPVSSALGLAVLGALLVLPWAGARFAAHLTPSASTHGLRARLGARFDGRGPSRSSVRVCLRRALAHQRCTVCAARADLGHI